MNIDLASLGISKEELENRLLDKLAQELLSALEYDPEDNAEYQTHSELWLKLNALVQQEIDRKVGAIADAHILPRVSEYIENLTLQKTNEWGQARGGSFTFIEYLTQRAEAYLTEQVDLNGKTRQESGSYGWSGKQTRIAHMIHEHLHYEIQRAMEFALRDANSAIVKGLESTVKMKLAEIQQSLKVKVQTR